MRITVVSNRNIIMLLTAIGWTISLNYGSVAFGVHFGEHTPIPDCQPQFTAALNAVTQLHDESPIEVLAPFVRLSK
jgi:7-cyano-7-deazaguanine synthase